MESSRQRLGGTRKGGSSWPTLCDRPFAAQLAPLVRGSSRRITTLRFRPAHIRVINRRDSLLGRCLLGSSEDNGGKTD